jgi:uncharacterized iron-regulated membrane protein
MKQKILWLHRWLGIISGLVVFVVAITGCLYVFEEECRDIFQHKYFYVTPTGSKQPLEKISAVVQQQYATEKITQIRFKEAPNAAIIYHTKSKKAISANPYTASIIGERNLETDFFNWVIDMHKSLHLGKVGEEIIRWNVLIFTILCISGLVLWWPKQKRFLQQAITIKWRTKNFKRLNWDLHSVLGFYALLILLIISLTGLFWVFDWAKQTVALATNSKVSKTKAPENIAATTTINFTMEAAYQQAKNLYPNATQTVISFPDKKTEPIRVLFRYPYTIVRKQNTIFFDKYSGKLLRADLYKNYTAYDKVMRSNFDFHTGRINGLGIGSKLIYFLASLIAASLPITGIIIWLGRKKKKIVPKKQPIIANNRTNKLAYY